MENIDFKKGFFEFISAAGNEKVHSQVLGWIFSDNCKALDADTKAEILVDLAIKKVGQLDLKIKKVEVEKYNIDILIECEDRFVVIENKIKSTEHSNQLYKYEFITANSEALAKKAYKNWKGEDLEEENFKIDTRFREKQATIYFYLTLIEENPNAAWINITYEDVYRALNEKHIYDRSVPDSLILDLYLQTIQRLTNIVNTFKLNPKEIPHVFIDGKSKNVLSGEEDINNYVRETQLETLLQKLFYQGIKKQLGDESISIGETHGWALMDKTIGEIELEKRRFKLLLQFQCHVVKFAIAPIEKIGKEKGKSEIDKIKKEFAEYLLKLDSSYLEKAFGIKEKSDVGILKKKISTPRSEDGFMSILLYKKEANEEPWQHKGKETISFVKKYIVLAQDIFSYCKSSS